MRSIAACILLLSLVAVAFAQKDDVARSWFTTFTLITGTATTTTTSTSVTTCTTSTTTLSTCTGGRRRRGLFYDESASNGKARRGLFYNDAEAEQADGSIFLVKREAKDEIAKPVKKADKKTENIIGLQVQSGFNVPEGLPKDRWGLTFGQTTVTTTTTTTSTSTLTATCASTTGFPTCGSGK
jgi:hypothetical protein